MNINAKTKRQLKIQNAFFYILVIIVVFLLAQLSIKTNITTDWTANSRHTLSETTTELLSQIQSDITIQVFISPSNEYKPVLESLLSRYQKHSNVLKVNYINPDFSPDLVRQFNIQQQGEMIITRGSQQSHVFDLSEQSLTNALISVSREKEQWLVFIEGHGERTPLSQENYNLNIWGEQLKQKGFKLQALNLIQNNKIPSNTAAVIIASPEQAWLEGEVNIIKNYIANGGNLLWLNDPNTHHHLSSLAEQLDIEFIPGTLIDPNAQLLGINDPQFSLINDYANHPIGEATSSVTLFPKAVAIEASPSDGKWQHISLLNSQENTWSSMTAIDKNDLPEFKLGHDTHGPLSIGFLLNRPISDSDSQEQRIAIIGDSDFLSNSYIGNAANLELGLALMNWLAQDDELIIIPVKTTLDNSLELSKIQSLIIGLGFLIGLPLILFIIGFVIWRIRRQR